MRKILITLFLWAIASSPAAAANAATCLAKPSESCIVDLIVETAESDATPEYRAATYAALSSVYEAAGQNHKAPAFLTKAVAAAEAAKTPEERDQAYAEIVEWRDRRDNVAGTREFAERIRPGPLRGETLEKLVRELVSQNRLNAAEQTAEKIELHRFRARAYRDVAMAYADAGKLEKAWNTYNAMLAASAAGRGDSTVERINARLPHPGFVLGRIAAAQVRAGDVEGAFETERTPHKRTVSPSVLGRIAVEQAKASDIEGALVTFQRIEQDDTFKGSGIPEIFSARDSALLSLIKVVARNGDFERAWKMLEFAQDDKLHDVAVASIAKVQAETDDPDAAIETLKRKRRPEHHRPVTQYAIAQALTRAGRNTAAQAHLDKAVRGLAEREHPIHIGRSRAGIASGRFEVGDTVGAKRVLAETLAYGKQVHGGHWYGKIGRDVGAVQARFGFYQESLATALSIQHPGHRGIALCNLLHFLLKKG